MNKENVKMRIYGIRPVLELINSGKDIQKIYIQKNIKNEAILDIEHKAKEKRIEIKKVPIYKLNKLTRKNHQGVFAFSSPISFISFENFLPNIYEKGEVPLFLALDRITDVRNFGSICRSAKVFGVHGIIIPKKNTAEINEISIKTSSGALTKIPICRTENFNKTILFAKNSGLKICSLSEHAKKNIYDVNLKEPILIILGSEKEGISNKVTENSDELVKIPSNEDIISLNVSVATGVILSEVKRQRG